MTKVKSCDIYGYIIEDFFRGNGRIYCLPSSAEIHVGPDPKKMEVGFKTVWNHVEDLVDRDEFFNILESARSLGLDAVVAVDDRFNNEVDSSPEERKFAIRLSSYPGLVQPAFIRLLSGKFDEPEFAALLTQCADPENFDLFLERCLKVEAWRAEQSLVGGQKPNYYLQVPELLESIGLYLGRKLDISGIPDILVGRTKYSTGGVEELINNSGFVHAIVQPNGSSFTYSPELQRHVSQLTAGLDDDLAKSRAVFDWVSANIAYGKEKRSFCSYRGALRVYQDKEGVCGESAALQVTMERLAGNIAFLAMVGEDHVCAAHIRSNGRVVLIDTTTPEGFDVKYDVEFNIVSDDLSLAKYR